MWMHPRLPAVDHAAASTRDANEIEPPVPGKHSLVEQLFADVDAAPGGASGSQDRAGSADVRRSGTATRPAVPDGDRLRRLFGPPAGAAMTGAPHEHEGMLADEAVEPDRGGGPLPAELRRRMERAFGGDFSGVQVFEGDQAMALGAIAYAQGDELHFAPGHYDPQSQAGQQLIGHELTHVVQQRAGRVSAPQGKGDPVNADPALEAEADALGERAARGERMAVANGASAVRGRASQAIQLTDFKGKVTGKPNQTKLSECNGRTVTFVVSEKDLGSNDRLTTSITAAHIKTKLGAQAPEFTFAGKLNELGEHTITFTTPKAVINVSVQLNKPRAVAKPDPYQPPEKKLAEPTPGAQKSAPHSAQFGTEFTFTNDVMFTQAKAATKDGVQQRDIKENLQKQRDWKAAMIAKAPLDLAYIEDTIDKGGCPSIKFTYTDGWWYCCSLDIACIETQTFKMSLADAEQRGWLARLQSDIFAIADQLKLTTHVTTGGGHYHLDLGSTFGGDFNLFRNFLVDFANNPLALEALENDPTNAPVIGQLQGDVRKMFRKLIKQFDQMNLATHFKTGNDAIVALADSLQYGVYKHAFSHLPTREQLDEPHKYQAVNVTRTADKTVGLPDKTVEIRALRAQRSVKEFLLVAQLLQARIAMLKRLGEKRLDYDASATRSHEHSDPSAVIGAFRQYVEHAGLAFSDYEALVHANMAERHTDWVAPQSATITTKSSSPGEQGGKPESKDAKPESKDAKPETKEHKPESKEHKPDATHTVPSPEIDIPLLEFDISDANENHEVTEVGPCDRRYRPSPQQIEVLKAHNLRLTGTRPDGDCIYNSINESANLGSSAPMLREQVAQWCEKNRELVIKTQFAELEPSQATAAFEKAVKAIRASSERSFLGAHGDLSLMALCVLLGRGLIALQPSGTPAVLADGGNPITLVFVLEPLPHYYGTKQV
jgi:Domain of unknown function (DUF4157)